MDSISSSSRESPLRPILCCKKRSDMSTFEESEDCFILDFDPYDYETLHFSKLSISKHADDDDDSEISVIAEKGKVACRDYPHPRHLCNVFEFDLLPHELYCKQCFCSVCDKAAPCALWTEPYPGHCHEK